MKNSTPLTPTQSQLAADNQGLVWRAALKLQNHGIDLDDLVGWGQLGLLHACRGFKHEHGTKFSTYATRCIWGEIRHAISSRSRMIRVPARLQNKQNRAILAACQPLMEAALGTPLCEIAIEDQAADPLVEGETADRVAAMLASLPPRDATVLRLRFGFDGGSQTLQEVGSSLGIGKERVRQIQETALKHLREQVGVAS